MENVNQTLGESLTFRLILDSVLVCLRYGLQRGKRPLSPARGILTPDGLLVWHFGSSISLCTVATPSG